MRQTRDSARACPRGRRKLEFDTQKHQLPLLNKAVYMDMKQCKQADLLEEQLKKLGARVEKFLSHEVNYVISSSGPLKADERPNNREENPNSPLNISSPFNCGPSVQPESRTSVVSRGKALAQIACAKNKASSVVANAEKLGIKVISAEAASKWLEKEMKKLKCFKDKHIKENKAKKTERKQKENKTKSKLLRGSFIKFEDMSRHYRPLKLELEKWPRLNLSVPPGICPFGEAKMKVQHHYVARNLQPQIDVVDCRSVPVKQEQALPQLMDDGARPAQKPAVAEFVGVPIATNGDARHILNCHLRKNVTINKQQGYCDCCGVKFQNIDEHITGEEHRSFARQKCNYESLDALINQVPSTVTFLQSVLLKHCEQKQGETSVSSCPADNLIIVEPLSPLTTEKTNQPSPEIMVTSVKIPDPSGAEMSTLKDKITDTDLISRQDKTPTKQEKMYDNRPQAVVIRRPLPSGMFTSPRRRQLTPSKKPWMQECSMVFRDSPIASLQPSCSSGQSFIRFLSDSTLDTKYKKVKMSGNCLTRLDVAKHKLISDEMLGTMLSKNFANLNNDFMLSEILGLGGNENQPVGNLTVPVTQICAARRSFNALQTFDSLNQEQVECGNKGKDSQLEQNVTVGQVAQEVVNATEEMVPQIILPRESQCLTEVDPDFHSGDVSYQLRDGNENLLLNKVKCAHEDNICVDPCCLLNPMHTQHQDLNLDRDESCSPQNLAELIETLSPHFDKVSVPCTVDRVAIAHDQLEKGAACKSTQLCETAGVVNMNMVSCTFTTGSPEQRHGKWSPLMEEVPALLFMNSSINGLYNPPETLTQCIEKHDKEMTSDIQDYTVHACNVESTPHLNCEETEEKGNCQGELTTNAVSKSLSKEPFLKQASDLPETLTGFVEHDGQEINIVSNADCSVFTAKEDPIFHENIEDVHTTCNNGDKLNANEIIFEDSFSLITEPTLTKTALEMAEFFTSESMLTHVQGVGDVILNTSPKKSYDNSSSIMNLGLHEQNYNHVNTSPKNIHYDNASSVMNILQHEQNCNHVTSPKNISYENTSSILNLLQHEQNYNHVNTSPKNSCDNLSSILNLLQHEQNYNHVNTSPKNSCDNASSILNLLQHEQNYNHVNTSPKNISNDNPSSILNLGQHEHDSKRVNTSPKNSCENTSLILNQNSNCELTPFDNLDMDLSGLNMHNTTQRIINEENYINRDSFTAEAAKHCFSANELIQQQTFPFVSEESTDAYGVEKLPSVSEESTEPYGVFPLDENSMHPEVVPVHENEETHFLTNSENINTHNSRNEVCNLLPLDDCYSNSGENDEHMMANQQDSELMELVVVPNIADRVKRRNRVVCLSLQSIFDKKGNTEKKGRLKRKRTVKIKNEDKLALAGIERLQLNDSTRQIYARNVASDTKREQVNEQTCMRVVPYIAKSVKRRRSCTYFNHEGQYANSGEGSDGDNVKIETQDGQKCSHRSCYMEKEETFECNKNGITKHLSVVLCRQNSVGIKIDENNDMKTRKVEVYKKTEDEIADFSSAVVIRRKKSGAYPTFPSQKRAEVDWGNLQKHKDSSSDQDINNDSICKETLLCGKTVHMDQSHSIPSPRGQCQSVIHRTAPQTGVVREVNVALVDINKTVASHHQADDETLVIHRARYKKQKLTVTSSQTSSSDGSQVPKTFSSSLDISCSPRLRLKIRRQPDNKGFSSTLEEIHDQTPTDAVFTSHSQEYTDKEKCTGKACPFSSECNPKQPINVSSPNKLHSLLHSQCADLMQSSSHPLNSCKRKTHPEEKMFHSDSLESPVKFQTCKKRAKLSLENSTSAGTYSVDKLYARQDDELSLAKKSHSTFLNNSLPKVQEINQPSSMGYRPKSPCFSSPISSKFIKSVATPKKYSNPSTSVSECQSPVFKMRRSHIKYRQESHCIRSALPHSRNFSSQEDSDLSFLALKNVKVDSSIKSQTAANNYTADNSHHLKHMSSLDFPSAKRAKLDSHRYVASTHESKQDSTPFDNFREYTDNAVSSKRTSVVSQMDLQNTELVINAEKTGSAFGPNDRWEAVNFISNDNTEPECEDSLIQVPTFSSPGKVTDSSWGDICDSYLSTSISKHNYQPSELTRLGKSPTSKEGKQGATSPFRIHLANSSCPTRKRTPKKESSRKQNTPNKEDGRRQTRSKIATSSVMPALGGETSMRSKANPYTQFTHEMIPNELRTPMKNSSMQLNSGIQQVDEVISFNYSSPQRLNFSPQRGGYKEESLRRPTLSSPEKYGRVFTHARCLFSPAKKDYPDNICGSHDQET